MGFCITRISTTQSTATADRFDNFIGSVYAHDYNTLSFIAHFPIELEKRNFPHICGRDAIITELSHYFWEGDHGKEGNFDISDFRLMVTNDQCL